MLLTREELQERLIALHRASLELVRNSSLETLLERIAAIACEQAGARYAAVGVLDEQGKLKQFITVGMTLEEIKRIPHPPRGHGLIGALMQLERIHAGELALLPMMLIGMALLVGVADGGWGGHLLGDLMEFEVG